MDQKGLYILIRVELPNIPSNLICYGFKNNYLNIFYSTYVMDIYFLGNTCWFEFYVLYSIGLFLYYAFIPNVAIILSVSSDFIPMNVKIYICD